VHNCFRAFVFFIFAIIIKKKKKKEDSNRKVVKLRFDSRCGSASLCPWKRHGPYYKSKLQLKSTSSEILTVNCKFICDSTPT